MKLKFLLDYTDSPIWSNDDETRQKFDYNIVDLESLGLSPSTRIKIHSLMKLFTQRLNPVYQGFPSMWSGRMHIFFQEFLKHVFELISNELSEKYQLENLEHSSMYEIIDHKKIDRELANFLENPSTYADSKGIFYTSKEKLKEEIQQAYKNWYHEELRWTSF